MFNMLLPDPPFPLAQSTEFEVGETFTVNASVDEDDDCYDSNSVSIKVYDSIVTCRDVLCGCRAYCAN